MQEIRDIVAARLSRRELLRLGLVMGGAGLLAMHGTRNFRPYWAHADDDGGGGITMTSPPNTPFQDPLPIPPVLQGTTLNPAPTNATNPTPVPGTYPNPLVRGFTEAARDPHQKWTQFGGASNTAPGFTGPQYELIQQAVSHNFYPLVNGQPPSTIWRYVDSTRSTNATDAEANPLIKAFYGTPIVVRIHDALPSDNGGFGINQTTTHLHNGHTASESDGGPTKFFDAHHFKDYHYANVRAGFASTHPMSALPIRSDGSGNGKMVPGDVKETMSFLWFHDHRFDFTAQNVYKGLASFFLLYSNDINLDTGDETTGLRLPSGEFDIPMIFADKVFDPKTGLLFFDLFNTAGILGDKYTVNGKIQPYLEVKRRKYRFRLLNGGPSRVYEFFLSNGQPFIQITNDGNLLPRPLTRKSVRLGVAERCDVIVDFTNVPMGSKIYLQNRLEQNNGRGPTGNIIAPTNLVEFRVIADVADNSRIPTALLALPDMTTAVRSRIFEFDEEDGGWVINERFFNPDVISFTPKQNTAETWTFSSDDEWQHPIHNHLEEFRILSRSGGIPADEAGRKDMARIGQAAESSGSSENVKIFLQFRDWLGDYPLHCHNTVHEDHAMMLRWQVVP